MIHLNGLTKSFGSRTLFEGVDWHIKPEQRVGLVGPNGVGKTTLLRIITGAITPDAGEMQSARSTTIGHLPQEIASLAGSTAREEARRGLAEVYQTADAMAVLERTLECADPDEASALMERYAKLQARYERLGGFTADSRVEEVLSGLGFRTTDFDRDCGELSGGWQMRVALARLLLMHPNVLLLDEPTNHLDLESVEWLESFLGGYGGSLVIISHDRAFLDRLCTHIADLSPDGLTLYTGNFARYLIEAESRAAEAERRQRNQGRRIAEMERFIDRFRAKATKARQVQSRVKQLEKMERVEARTQSRTIDFRFPQPPRCGRVAMALEDVDQAYGDNVVYRGLDVHIERGRKIALVGPNGAGKSTLLKILAGVVPIRRGFRSLGHKVRAHYFDQHQVLALDPSKSVFEEAMLDASGLLPARVRTLLGVLLFSGDAIEKKVSVLSGGEKNRLALAKMMMKPANVLLMDEPTNHLDMPSRVVLGQALAEYEGAVVMISHDRHFIDLIADEIWDVRDGRITPYVPPYDEFVARRANGPRPEPLPLHGEAILPVPAVEASVPTADDDTPRGGQRRTREQKREDAMARKARSARTRDARRAVESAEALVHQLEADLQALREVQADSSHYSDSARVQIVAREASEIESKLEAAYNDWTGSAEVLEVLEAEG